MGYEQHHHGFLQQVFGFGPDATGMGDSQVTQHLGGVVCRQGRLLTFPNILQHRVSPFSLADRSKPGHRKILALFLVDPHVRIISTANVPPQRVDWGKEKCDLVQGLLSSWLPIEMQQIILREGALEPLMTMEEAKELRLELMKERSAKSQVQNEHFEHGVFGLCEH